MHGSFQPLEIEVAEAPRARPERRSNAVLIGAVVFVVLLVAAFFLAGPSGDKGVATDDTTSPTTGGPPATQTTTVVASTSVDGTTAGAGSTTSRTTTSTTTTTTTTTTTSTTRSTETSSPSGSGCTGDASQAAFGACFVPSTSKLPRSVLFVGVSASSLHMFDVDNNEYVGEVGDLDGPGMLRQHVMTAAADGDAWAVFTGAGGSGPFDVQMWDPARSQGQQLVGTFQGHTAEVVSLAFVTGRGLLSAAKDLKVVWWDGKSRSAQATIALDAAGNTAAHPLVAGNAQHVFAAFGTKIQRRSFDDGLRRQQVLEMPPGNEDHAVTAMAVGDAGVYAGTAGGAVLRWDATTLAYLGAVGDATAAGHTIMALTVSGPMIIVAAMNGEASALTEDLGEAMATYQATKKDGGHPSVIHAVAGSEASLWVGGLNFVERFEHGDPVPRARFVDVNGKPFHVVTSMAVLER